MDPGSRFMNSVRINHNQRVTVRRVTQLDIARKAGVSRSTVTYALRRHPKIPESTRLHIEKVAREMGYVPDPVLASLAYYRNQCRPTAYHGTLAWLVYTNYDYRRSPHYSSYFEGASQQALHHGYKVEEFRINPDERHYPNRAVSILRSRGVSGILVGPLPGADMNLKFLWDSFAFIAFGYTLTKPTLNSVASGIFQNTQRALRELRARGYRRIGLVIDPLVDRRCKMAFTSAFFGEQILHIGAESVIPTLNESFFERRLGARNIAELEAYVQRYSLDAVVSDDYCLMERLQLSSLSVPDVFGAAGIGLPEPDMELSGVVEDSRRVGALAVDLLVRMIQRGEWGIPEFAVHSFVEGIWNEGTTLRPKI